MTAEYSNGIRRLDPNLIEGLHVHLKRLEISCWDDMKSSSCFVCISNTSLN